MPNGKSVIALVRLEDLALGIVCVWLYHAFQQSWWLFAILFLVPDLSILAYLRGPKVGALVYNVAHSWATCILVFFIFVYVFGGGALLLSLPLIWGAHIGFDRALGFGLKLPTAFKDTHLGPIGKLADAIPRVSGG